MVKIYHASPWYNYSNWIKGATPVKKVEDANLVLFCGGTDVYAGRYGQKSHKFAEHPDHPRDEEEIALFKKATALGIPMLGICRGLS
jgi:putative glutamine amidotransferase